MTQLLEQDMAFKPFLYLNVCIGHLVIGYFVRSWYIMQLLVCWYPSYQAYFGVVANVLPFDIEHIY